MGIKCCLSCFSSKKDENTREGVVENTPDGNTPQMLASRIKCCLSCFSSKKDENTPDGGVENTPDGSTPDVGVENTPDGNTPHVGVENTPHDGITSEVVEDENTLCIRDLSNAVEDIGDIEELITFIQRKVEAPTDTTARSQQDPSTSQKPDVALPEWKTCFNSAEKLLLNVVKRVQKDTPEGPSRVKVGDKLRKSAIDILKESVKIHWLGIVLSGVGYVLEHIDQVRANKKECVSLLRNMLALANHCRKLNKELPETTETLNDVVGFIVEGCITCVSQVENHYLFRLISAPVDAEEIKKFESELVQKYLFLTTEAAIGIINRTPHFLPQTQGRNPDAVGIENAQDTVTRLLQLEVNDQTRRAVVIHGLGGMGKTTLGTAVFNQLPLKDNSYKFSRLVMDESCSNDRIRRLQQQLLFDLFGENVELRDHVEGQEKLTRDFSGAPSQRVFMFIDNALKESDLANLLPKQEDLSCLPKQTRILLTTRNPEECRRFFEPVIQCRNHAVEVLNEAHSKQILCRKALGRVHDTFHQDLDIDGLVKICGGIPLVLDLVGSQLRMHVSNVSACKILITSLKESVEQGEQEICERVVDVVYNSLNTDCKEAFLDIACFFHNWERSLVSYVVGDRQLKALENAALVKISHDPSTSTSLKRFPEKEHTWQWYQFERDIYVREGFLEVHDIVKARGRKLSESDRIMDVESLAVAVEDRQNLKNIKGIIITDRMSKIVIDAEHLDLMHASLRTLYIEASGRRIEVDEETKINGKCRKDFKNLRCLYLPSKTSLCMDLAKLKSLGVLCAEFSDNPSELPSSLHCLVLRAVPDFQLSLNESFGKLTLLKELQLKNDVMLPQNFGDLKFLRILRLSNCKMVTLPQSFGSLSALERLSIESCGKLQSLPMSFGEIQKLAFLQVISCPRLSSLSENFVKLTSLRTLIMHGCSELSPLPESFGNLSSLEKLDLEGYSKLVSVPESFGNLSCLKKLKMSRCEGFFTLPESFGNLSSLEDLNLRDCAKLVSVPESFGNLSCLKKLRMYRCSELSTLPESFGNLSSLEELYLSGSSKLVSVPESFGNLSCLKELKMYECEGLSTLPESFGNLSSLEQLYLNGCSKLVSVPESFGNLRCLKKLIMEECSELSTLPESFGNLSRLEELKISKCNKLVCLPNNFGQLKYLANLHACDCHDLKEEAMDVLVEMKSLKYLSICGSDMLIKRWEDARQPKLASGNSVSLSQDEEL